MNILKFLRLKNHTQAQDTVEADIPTNESEDTSPQSLFQKDCLNAQETSHIRTDILNLTQYKDTLIIKSEATDNKNPLSTHVGKYFMTQNDIGPHRPPRKYSTDDAVNHFGKERFASQKCYIWDFVNQQSEEVLLSIIINRGYIETPNYVTDTINSSGLNPVQWSGTQTVYCHMTQSPMTKVSFIQRNKLLAEYDFEAHDDVVDLAKKLSKTAQSKEGYIKFFNRFVVTKEDIKQHNERELDKNIANLLSNFVNKK